MNPGHEAADLPQPPEGAVSPELGAFVTDDSGEVYELQGPTVEEGVGQVRLEDRRGDNIVELLYAKSVHQYQKCSPESRCRKLHYSMTDLFVRMSDFLYQYRDKSGELLADKSISQACEDLRDYLGSRRDFAPESLIVRIARETQASIKDIVENPRVVLRREHQQVPLDRMQEIDVYALQDYARRPGRTSAMKAGHRQRLMAVVRNETPDTYENRVVRTFIELSEGAARQYKEEMCSRCPRRGVCIQKDPLQEESCPSERIKTVASFSLFCKMMLNTSHFMSVARLAEPKTQPNYVLQQNPRYLIIWKFYQRLLRQEDVESDVWKWKRRTWSDVLRLFMMYFWCERIPRIDSFVMQTSRKPFMIRPENERGGWLCSDPFEDGAVFKFNDGYVTFYILNKESVDHLIGPEFQRLNADFFWVAKSSTNVFRTRIMPVWCFCPDESWEEGVEEKAGKVCGEIKAMLSEWQQKYQDYDLSKSVVFFPASDCKITTLDGGHRFYEVNLFNSSDVARVFDKLQNWVEGVIK